MTNRREILKALGIATLAQPLAGLAQQPQKVRRIGILLEGSPLPDRRGTFVEGLMDLLRRLGYEEGRNLVIEWRAKERDHERGPALVNELVLLNVELIVTFSNESTLAAKRGNRTIPIVMGGSWHTIEHGLIDSHSHPGGNITGLDWWPGPQMSQKILQILKDAVPGARRAAQVWNPKQPTAHLYGDEHLREVASNTGLTIVSAVITQPEDLPGALDRVSASRAEVLYVPGDPGIPPLFREIAAFAVKRKLVSISGHSGYTAAGGLLYFGAEVPPMLDRLASYIDRILRGAKPADLPVEYPTKFELVLNKTTAKAIGVTFPPSFMLRVDRTIE